MSTYTQYYRVRGIPEGVYAQELAQALSRIWPSNQQTVSYTIRSFSDDLWFNHKIAVREFLNEDMALQAISLKLTFDRKFDGLTVLYSPMSGTHELNVVALHGPNYHAWMNFRAKDTTTHWLTDLLPMELPSSRVLIYGYSQLSSASSESLQDLGSSLQISLRRLIRSADRDVAPILFIAHSVGGLILKEALISMSQSTNEADKRLLHATSSLFFFGTPHRGMEISFSQKLSWPIVMVESLLNKYLTLIQQCARFSSLVGTRSGMELFCFYETSTTAAIVTKSSATDCGLNDNMTLHKIALRRTHSQMVRFNEHDEDWATVSQLLQDAADKAVNEPFNETKSRTISLSQVNYSDDAAVIVLWDLNTSATDSESATDEAEFLPDPEDIIEPLDHYSSDYGAGVPEKMFGIHPRKLGHATEILIYIGYHGHGDKSAADREFRSGKFAALHWGFYKTGLKMYDFALIKTSSPFDSATFIPWRNAIEPGTSADVRVVGFPGDIPKNAEGRYKHKEAKGRYLYESECSIQVPKLEEWKFLLRYELDTFGGNSGSPVLAIGPGEHLQAIDVHCYGFKDHNAASILGRKGNHVEAFIAALSIKENLGNSNTGATQGSLPGFLQVQIKVSQTEPEKKS
ncbi:hypothetical protein N431DRAFT_551245 [Stipitochalara longipes BDJ]|nr:hypothetical protein N431DRAFT_551245 [Stipitochalara longipes BDJ]